MKHNFEERKQNKIDYAQQQAAKNEQKAKQLHEQAQKMASAIPLGQPIHIGHHSEKADRNYRKKITNTFRKSFEAVDKADYYEQKAKNLQENNAIFSDDPLAVNKLKEKLDYLTTLQEFMKAANKCIRKKDKAAFLALPHGTENRWTELTTPDFLNRVGFASYQLQNNNANMVRIKQRIAALEKQANAITTETTINGVQVVENVEANRVQLIFPGKPAEAIREKLKKNGFRWCRSEGAWQRHLTPNAVYWAKQLVKTL